MEHSLLDWEYGLWNWRGVKDGLFYQKMDRAGSFFKLFLITRGEKLDNGGALEAIEIRHFDIAYPSG